MIPISVIRESPTSDWDSVRTGSLWFWAVFNLRVDSDWHPVHLRGMAYNLKYDTVKFN
jgi:hypothetical protein